MSRNDKDIISFALFVAIACLFFAMTLASISIAVFLFR